jgi:hypothetical protein
VRHETHSNLSKQTALEMMHPHQASWLE